MSENRGNFAPGCQLYRHYDKDGILLYVGISLFAVTRAAAHRHGSSWYWRSALMTIENYSTRHEAIKAESEAIKSERPIFNTIGISGERCHDPQIVAVNISDEKRKIDHASKTLDRLKSLEEMRRCILDTESEVERLNKEIEIASGKKDIGEVFTRQHILWQIYQDSHLDNGRSRQRRRSQSHSVLRKINQLWVGYFQRGIEVNND